MASESSPTVRGRFLALELKRLRDWAELTQLQAAQGLGWSESKISRIEAARQGVSAADVERLIGMYGVSEGERLKLLELARAAKKRGWWQKYGGAFTGPFVGLEDGASRIWEWEPQLVPGLLQTADYAREVIRAGLENPTEADVRDRVQARMARRELLNRGDDAPHLHAIIDEAVLRRTIGDADVMRDQLYELAARARRSNVTLQVMPFSAGTHAGLEGPHIVLGFDEDVLDIGFVEVSSGPVYLESVAEVALLKLKFERLTSKALSPEKSADLVKAALEEA